VRAAYFMTNRPRHRTAYSSVFAISTACSATAELDKSQPVLNGELKCSLLHASRRDGNTGSRQKQTAAQFL
jgi:hypothetical protein